MARKFYFLSLSMLIIGLAGEVFNLDLDGELKRLAPLCGSIPLASNVNMTWIRTEEVWYFPFVTRSELLLATYTVLKNEIEFKGMTEHYARENICYIMNFKSNFDAFGFGKRLLKGRSQLYFNPIRKGAVDWEYEGEYAASTYIVMTDNKSFAVGIDVFPDGSRGGYVMTPYSNVKGIFKKDQVEKWTKKLKEAGGFEEESLLELPVECAAKFWEDLKKKDPKLKEESTDELELEQITTTISSGQNN